MSIVFGYSGLAIAFVILVSILLYLIIDTKRKPIIKFLFSTLCVWYSLILLYTPVKLMGWPTTTAIPPNTIVLNVIFDEPKSGSKGAIYILGLTKQIVVGESIWEQLDYKNIFSYNTFNMPRFYRLDYNRKNHSYLRRKWKEALKRNHMLMYSGREDAPDSSDRAGDATLLQGLFRVVNPAEILTKGEENSEQDGNNDRNN